MTRDELFVLSHALNSMEIYLDAATRQLDERGVAAPSALINISGYLKTAQMLVDDALKREPIT